MPLTLLGKVGGTHKKTNIIFYSIQLLNITLKLSPKFIFMFVSDNNNLRPPWVYSVHGH